MKFIKLFEHFRGSLFPTQFSPPEHIPHLKERFLKELDLSDFNDIIYNMKDDFNMELVTKSAPASDNWYSIIWETPSNKIAIYFVFLSKFYLENKNKIDDHLEEFEDRLSDFEFNSGITTSLGQNTKAFVNKWNKTNVNGHINGSNSVKYFVLTYHIEARFKV